MPEVHVLRDGAYEACLADEEGWFIGPVTGVALRPRPGNRVELRYGTDAATAAVLPEA